MAGIGLQISNTYEVLISDGNEGETEMSWDYRVIFSPFEEGSDEGEYTIREVYYDDEGEISWYSDDSVQLSSENFWDLAADFDAIAEAFEQPVLVLIGEDLVEDDSEEESEDEEEEETEE